MTRANVSPSLGPEALLRALVHFGYALPDEIRTDRKGALDVALSRVRKFGGKWFRKSPEIVSRLIAGKRCGVPDVQTIANHLLVNVSRLKWNTSKIHYRIQNTPAGVALDQVRASFETAIQMWTQHIQFDIEEAASGNDFETAVAFLGANHSVNANDPPFDGAGGILGHAFGPNPSLGTLAGDVHFDDEETWSVELPVPSGHTDLTTVAAHELGHVIGFNHSPNPESIMFASYEGSRNQISDQDRVMAQSVYGVR
jgi:hypothetical protein